VQSTLYDQQYDKKIENIVMGTQIDYFLVMFMFCRLLSCIKLKNTIKRTNKMTKMKKIIEGSFFLAER